MKIFKFGYDEIEKANELLANPEYVLAPGSSISYRDIGLFIHVNEVAKIAILTLEDQLKNLDSVILDKKISLQNKMTQADEALFQFREAEKSGNKKFAEATKMQVATTRDAYELELAQVTSLIKLRKEVEAGKSEFYLGADVENVIEKTLAEAEAGEKSEEVAEVAG